MPKVFYIAKKFSPLVLNIIAQAEKIIQEYVAQGFELTLRQLYYPFVARVPMLLVQVRHAIMPRRPVQDVRPQRQLGA